MELQTTVWTKLGIRRNTLPRMDSLEKLFARLTQLSEDAIDKTQRSIHLSSQGQIVSHYDQTGVERVVEFQHEVAHCLSSFTV